MTILNAIRQFVHDQPIAHVAWACTAIAVVLILLVLPAMSRRLRLRGNRATGRIALLIVLVCCAFLLLAELDRGYRTHIDQAFAYEPSTEYAQVLEAKHPFPIDGYYAFQRGLAPNKRIAGTIPEVRLPAVWDDLRTQSSFAATLVGLPDDISTTFSSRRPRSAPLKRMLDSWQRKLNSAPLGDVYVTAGLAQTEHIRPQDVVTTILSGVRRYPRVVGTLPDGQVAGAGPAIIMPLAFAQQQVGLPAKVTSVEIVFDAPDSATRRSTRRYILNASAAVPDSKLSSTAWTYASKVKVLELGDANRWLAVGPAIVVALSALILRILGRRSLTAA